ncbi:Lar family restriction alleviation protein [Roseomonas mucosa]|uniref:Lar family restriction alleviation protein n=1 Tax=Roseomonas mucosa TaxID=207340 RepID=UPI002247B5AA|nr:Lar family restriction alleviation protein [Roseomonas mucosa]UZO91747.1 Restriction alleviation and modification enhancement protein [Roseomonas mucosa]
MSDAQRLLDLAARVEALLPCPFCGSPASEGCGGPKQHWISCDGCSVEGPIEQEMFQAVAAWNTRTPEATHLREVNAALVEAAKVCDQRAKTAVSHMEATDVPSYKEAFARDAEEAEDCADDIRALLSKPAKGDQ